MDEAEAALERLGGSEPALTVRMPELDVSSTAIRHRVDQGKPIRYPVPEPVRAMIVSSGLYRESVVA